MNIYVRKFKFVNFYIFPLAYKPEIGKSFDPSDSIPPPHWSPRYTSPDSHERELKYSDCHVSRSLIYIHICIYNNNNFETFIFIVWIIIIESKVSSSTMCLCWPHWKVELIRLKLRCTTKLLPAALCRIIRFALKMFSRYYKYIIYKIELIYEIGVWYGKNKKKYF